MSHRVGPISDHDAWNLHGFRASSNSLTNAESLPKAWAARWRTDATAPALSSPGGEWVSRGQLLHRTGAVAASFAEHGVTSGDRILMSASPSVELVIAHVAALRLGAIVVPVNTAYTSPELRSVAEQARPALAVLDDPGRLPGIPSVTPDALFPTQPPRETPTPLLDSAMADDPAMLMFTSGTTGRPKGVVLSHGNILASAEALRVAWHWTPDDRLVLSLPLFHMHGLGVGVHGTLLAGASAVIVEKFDVDTVFDTIRDASATLFFGVPTMWVRIAESPRVKELATLRLCVSGSAPLSPDVFRALQDRGGQTILERYGMTETVMNVSNPYVGERRAGSVGLALPGVQVRLAGDPSLTPTEPGEILLKGPNVMHTYWENASATAAAFDADGWFLTGDIGQFDTDGYLSIVGRSKDLIITGGFNVYPREVEEALLLHPAVAECAVLGAPDAQWGETVVAYVVASEKVSEQNILEHAATHLARFKRPRSIRFIDALPRNALGKVVKSELH
jgi:malonyl-CoA/methylmalonyl-CoA synthetase